ncbi:hypothetical protein Leryth_025259 [Lithospermum erythrorhizon]|nr:hypothetical protein Leryth_025259 [Lithospermum erythrorhizon]
MSGVWVFKNNGVVRLVENPGEYTGIGRRKVLVHVPSNEIVTCQFLKKYDLTSFNSTRDPLFISSLYQEISTNLSPCTCLTSLLKIETNLKLEICNNNV